MPATKEILQEGRYRIGQQSRQFSHDNVYDAVDTINASNVVIREITLANTRAATQSQRETQKSSFDAQVKLLTELKHESLLHIQDFFSEADRQYLIMEAVEGDTLQELVKRNRRPFPMPDALAWADQLLDALNYLHTAVPRVIHRNIRPENVVLCSNGRVKLQGPATSESEFDASADASLPYAPLEMIWSGLDVASQTAIMNGIDERSERILKEPADARTDLYSLGATLYFLVTGQPPVGALERAIEILDGNLDPLTAPSKLDPAIPVEISDVIVKSMEIKRENRYDAAAIMRQVLKTAQLRAGERLGGTASEPPAYGVSAEPRIADELPEIAKPEISLPPNQPVARTEKRPEAAPAQPLPTPAAPVSKPAAKAAFADDDLPSFGSSEDQARSGIGKPVIAVAAIVLIGIIGTAMFLVFSGGSANQSTEKATQAPATQSRSQPVPDTTSASGVIPANDPAGTEPAATDAVASDSRVGGKTPTQTASARAKKTGVGPAKPAKEKKPVTVDDLINDN